MIVRVKNLRDRDNEFRGNYDLPGNKIVTVPCPLLETTKNSDIWSAKTETCLLHQSDSGKIDLHCLGFDCCRVHRNPSSDMMMTRSPLRRR